MWALLLGRALLAKGQVRAALTQLRKATELLRQHDIGSLLSWSLAAQAMASTLLGELPAATELLAEAERCHHPGMHSHDTELALASAWLTAAQGEHTKAGRLALDAATTAGRRGQHVLEAMALHDATRLGMAGLHRRIPPLRAGLPGALEITAHGFDHPPGTGGVSRTSFAEPLVLTARTPPRLVGQLSQFSRETTLLTLVDPVRVG